MTTTKKTKKPRVPKWIQIVIVIALLAWLFVVPFKKNMDLQKNTSNQTVPAQTK